MGGASVSLKTAGYRTHVFDCDGVLMASNRVKELAFYDAARAFGAGEFAAIQLVEYHINAGATGRRARVDYFFDTILADALYNYLPKDESARAEFLADVTRRVTRGMEECEPVKGSHFFLSQLMSQTPAKLVVVSGIAQAELERILTAHKFMPFFSCVVGTESKAMAIAHMLQDGTIERPAVYYGDTYDDARAAVRNGLDFVLVYGDQSDGNRIRAIKDFGEA